jgi:hypothetical protein
MTDDPVARVAGLEQTARRAGEALARAFGDGADEGRRLDGVLRDVERSLAAMAIRTAASTAGSLAGQALSSLSPALAGLANPLAGALGSLAVDRLLGSRDAPARAGPAPRPVSVSVQIATPDPASFRRSEAQVAAGLARAVQRGVRGM